MGDVEKIPFLWSQWVRYKRDYPPTQEELQEYEDYQEELKLAVRRYEERVCL